jgi:hypothetical protein
VKNVGGQLRSRAPSLFTGYALDERITFWPNTLFE